MRNQRYKEIKNAIEYPGINKEKKYNMKQLYNHDAGCNDFMALTTDQFMEKYDMTVDEMLMLFLPREEFQWDPSVSRFVHKQTGENDADMLEELFEEERERERKAGLVKVRKELERRFGYHGQARRRNSLE